MLNIIYSQHNYYSFSFNYIFGAPYAPTHKSDLFKLFETINLSKEDALVDISSGDGAVLKVAHNFNAKAISFEINPFLVIISKIKLRKQQNCQIYLKKFLESLPDFKHYRILYFWLRRED